MIRDSRVLGDSVNLIETPEQSPERVNEPNGIFRNNYMMEMTPESVSQSVRNLNIDRNNSDLLEMGGTPTIENIDPEEEENTTIMIEERKRAISRFSNLTEQVQ